jgi:hypothetical protein
MEHAYSVMRQRKLFTTSSECCVACCLWEIVAEIMNMPVIRYFESQAKWWIRGGKYNAANVFHAAVLWSNRKKEEITFTFREKAGEVCKLCWETAQEP